MADQEDYEIFPIPWRKAKGGCKLSVENAKRLAEDARLLRQNSRPQSALWVALTAWEELGKAVLLLRYYKQKEDISRKDWFKVLRDHKSKRVAYVHSMDILFGSSPPKSVKQLKHDLEKALEDKGWREWFSIEREIGVHVDWIESVHHGKPIGADWQSPCKIGKELFSSMPLDSEYWRRAVTANCKRLESILLTLPNGDS